MSPRAVFGFIVSHPGKTLFNMEMSRAQPRNTDAPRETIIQLISKAAPREALSF
jgi:hypothetical protein